MANPLVAWLICATILTSAPALAEQRHDHAHDHAPVARSVYDGYFDDAQVADRPLTDWQGSWQSVYPLLQSGVLDPVMAYKATQGDKSAADQRAYYETGYQTDVTRLDITAESVTFHRDAETVQGIYAPDGHEILTYAKGNRGVRFIFRKIGGDAAAPGFIQFSDHAVAPVKAGHFHLYWGDDRAALLAEVTHWPTYYPAQMTGAEIVEEMLAH